jgi:FtsH-binding integral membrane protein
MTTFAGAVPDVAPDPERRERAFLLAMSVLLALTVATGFGLFVAIGISSFRSPWWVHVHALSFVGWIALYLMQNVLVFKGDLASHRTLGRAGAVLAAWLVLVGLVLTPVTVAVHRSPPFFAPPVFLAMDWANIVAFGGLVCAGILNRRRSDWHRRLMLCATVCVIAPACGRILVLAGAMTPWNNVLVLLGYIALAAAFDVYNRRRIHPAYAWGAGTLLAMGASIPLLAAFPPLAAYANSLAGG